MSLLYQAMPIHKIFSTENTISLSISSNDDTSSESKDDSFSKKLKSETDDYVSAYNYQFIIHQTSVDIYYFHHLPKSFEVNSVFAPPPELG